VAAEAVAVARDVAMVVVRRDLAHAKGGKTLVGPMGQPKSVVSIVAS
jgi:hypothetical protein